MMPTLNGSVTEKFTFISNISQTQSVHILPIMSVKWDQRGERLATVDEGGGVAIWAPQVKKNIDIIYVESDFSHYIH